MSETSEAHEVDRQASQLKNLRAPITDELIPSDLREVFNEKLRLYQKETVNFLIMRYNEYMRGLNNPDIKSTEQGLKQLTGFIVGHEMGLGKTVMVLFFLRCIVKHPHLTMRPKRIIIVVQKILLQQWKQEISKWCQAIPLYTYHGTSQQRRKKLIHAKDERVCIILTTYAMLSNDGEYIMNVLKDEPVLQSNLIPIIDSGSVSDDSVSSNDSKHTSSSTFELVANDEAGSTDHIDLQSSDSDSSFPDPVLEFSWMMKKRSKGAEKNAASVAAHRLERLSLQTVSEPKMKRISTSDSCDLLLQKSSTSTTQAQATNQSTLDTDTVLATDNDPDNLMYRAPPPSNQLPKHCIDVLIMDEATAIKNTSTNASRGLRNIDVGFKLALTGTPIMNNLGELWSIVDYVNPDYLGKKAQFDKNIAKPINEAEAQDATLRERHVARKVRRALRDKLHPILIRRTTADLGPLGVNKIAITFWIPLNEVQFILYGSVMRARSFQEIYCNPTDYTKMIHLLHFLRKICDNPCELSSDDAAFFNGDLEKAINILKQKATQPHTRDSDYLQVVKHLQISKETDQSIFQQDTQRSDELFAKNPIDICGEPSLSVTEEKLEKLENISQSDAFDNDSIDENDSSSGEKDAQDWVMTQSLDDYLHKSPDHYDLAVRSITALSSKYTLFMELITHIKDNNHRVLIFCDYQIVFNMLEHLLSHSDIPYLRLDGTVSDVSERNRICTSFNTNKRYTALLISIKMGSMGLNITGANRIILFAPAWSLQAEEQAIARAYRIGQTRNVVVYKLACINTMEEKMVVRQLQKAAIANVTLNNEKHQSVIRKADVASLFEFNVNKRLEGQLPENIKHHAKPEHVKLTIQQTLGSPSNNGEKTEADKELEFVRSLMDKKLCVDVSVLDYLHSKENIDMETDIYEQGQAQSQYELYDFDRILAVGQRAYLASRTEGQNLMKNNYSQLISIYIESHQCTYFRTTMSTIFKYCGIKPSSLNDTLETYHKRVRDSIYNEKVNGNAQSQASRRIITFVDLKNRMHVREWQRYLSWAALMVSVGTVNMDRLFPILKQIDVTSQRRLRLTTDNSETRNLYSYLKLQFNSIISHFIIEIKQTIIADMIDICEICCTSTLEEYIIYLHNLIVSRINLYLSNKTAFSIVSIYPATLDIVQSLCQGIGISLTNLIVECSNPNNWMEPKLKRSLSMILEKKKIPLLWGPTADEFTKVQKSTLITLLHDTYGHIDYSILDKCLVYSEQLNTESQTMDATQNAILLKNIENCFNNEISNIQKNNIFSNIKNQYNLMRGEIKMTIFQDTYQKLCYYQSVLLKSNQYINPMLASIENNYPTITLGHEKIIHPTLPFATTTDQPLYEDEYNINIGNTIDDARQQSGTGIDSINFNREGSNHDEDDDSIDLLA